MRSFRHINAATIEEACTLLRDYDGRAKINAGGSDLILTLKDAILPDYPEAVINIKNIPDMKHISDDGEFIKIGSLVTLDEICRSSLLQERYPILVRAAKSVASPQIRNIATIGGNLCQGVRCWYYRYSSKIGGPVKCLRKGNGPCLAIKGDNRYHAIIGGNKCYAVCPSDTAVSLTALDSTAILSSMNGDRSIPVQDLYSPLCMNIKRDEILKEIVFPFLKSGSGKQNFIKFTLRKPIDYATVSVATLIAARKGVCTDARIVLGAVAPQPYRAVDAESYMRGKSINEETATKAAEKALAESKPLSKNAYKINIAKSLIKEALLGGASSDQ